MVPLQQRMQHKQAGHAQLRRLTALPKHSTARPPTHLELRQQQLHVGRHVPGVVDQGAQIAHDAGGALLQVTCGGGGGRGVDVCFTVRVSEWWRFSGRRQGVVMIMWGDVHVGWRSCGMHLETQGAGPRRRAGMRQGKQSGEQAVSAACRDALRQALVLLERCRVNKRMSRAVAGQGCRYLSGRAGRGARRG